MLGLADLHLFVLAGLLLNITPGPDMAYVMGRSARHGWPAGAVAALGIGAGCIVHVIAGAIGVTALLAASAVAFTALKIAGAAYLIWIGLSLLLAKANDGADAPAMAPKTDAASPGAIFVEAFLINVFNPKVALFFLAFLPQFIAPDAPSKALAFVVLGCIFNCTGTAWNLLVAWGTARTARMFSAGSGVRRWLDRAMGALFVGLGVKLALLQRA